MQKYTELVCVTENNNNKYYKMEYNGGPEFTVRYGRVGSSENVFSYPISEFEKKYNEKIKKGYKDITSLKTIKSTSSFKDITDLEVKKFLDDLQKYAKKSISENYTVTSEEVSISQIEEAQKILDSIASIIKKDYSNSSVDRELTRLYTVIPRRMKNVKDFILNGTGDKSLAKEILKREQEAIDTLEQQVSLHSANNTDNKEQTLEEALGLKIEAVSDQTIINSLKEKMGSDADRIVKVFKVINRKTQERFDEQKGKSYKTWTKELFHGSRNENWLSIIKNGLMIRPTGVITTGSMFGNGIYFADKAAKSIGYSSIRGSYWARGSEEKGYLAVYEVNTGMEYRIQSHTSSFYSFDEKALHSTGEYDCLFAKGGVDLRNNEFVIYNQDKCTIKYVIEIK